MNKKELADTIIDPELGILKWNHELDFWEEQIILSSEKTFKLYIFSRNNTQRSIEPMSRTAISRIQESESACRKYILDDLLETYNVNWSEGETISGEEFNSRISPDCIDIHEDGYAEVHFDDGGLFLGHSIGVRFEKDGTFQEVDLKG